MRIENQLYQQIKPLSQLPETAQIPKQTAVMAQFVPFLATTGIQFDVLNRETVTVSIQNIRAVQNHIQGVHACAMATLAETATGFVVSLNTPDNKLPLLKSMHINYMRLSKGDMTATATLNDEQALRMQNEDKGDFEVVCQVSDERHDCPPIEVIMTWAWVTKR
jgi:acyl-coenzyme A thioesterase PaaI-like protein